MSVNRTVYVVDDNESMRTYLLMLLEDKGYAPKGFDTGEAFLEALPNLDPGCVILDMRMPGRNGLQVQTEMAREGNNLPVVAVTGHGDVEMAVDSMRLGAVDFLQKPCLDATLLDAVDRGFRRLESASA